MAARAAWRGFGAVEPNPLVGCVLVRHDSASLGDPGKVVGIGHHRVFGGLHAEREALLSCARAGEPGAAKGATAYVTLEPCNGHGKQPPCVEALIGAGVSRVVFAEQDPSATKGRGQETLRRAGIMVEQRAESVLASRTSAPWRKHLATGIPWVIVKWAQTIDGKVAARDGDSKWISDRYSRRLVHTLRARVDAIVTGIGTVLADDPMLNARDHGGRIRRVAARIVLDSNLRTPAHGRLVQSAVESGPVWILGAAIDHDLTTPSGLLARERALLDAGALVRTVKRQHSVPFDAQPVQSHPHAGAASLDLLNILRWIGSARSAERPDVAGLGAQTVLIEAGPRIVGQLLLADLVDEIVGFTGPVLLGDPLGMGIVGPTTSSDVGRLVSTIGEARADRAWELGLTRRVAGGDDIMSVWRRKR